MLTMALAAVIRVTVTKGWVSGDLCGALLGFLRTKQNNPGRSFRGCL